MSDTNPTSKHQLLTTLLATVEKWRKSPPSYYTTNQAVRDAWDTYQAAPDETTRDECKDCLQLIDERDRAQDALQDTHLALGGDGEWVGRLPPCPAPDSGDLHFDVPELARERMGELVRYRANCTGRHGSQQQCSGVEPRTESDCSTGVGGVTLVQMAENIKLGRDPYAGSSEEPSGGPANDFSDLGPKKRLVNYACGCCFWRDEAELDGRCPTHARAAVKASERASPGVCRQLGCGDDPVSGEDYCADCLKRQSVKATELQEQRCPRCDRPMRRQLIGGFVCDVCNR